MQGVASIVFPTRDLAASVETWTRMLDSKPAFVGEDFALFDEGDLELGVSSAPWVDHPLVFWKVDDVEAAHRRLVADGATPLGEIADGSLAELGTAQIANGDPATGIVEVPGGRLAVLRAPDGNLVGLTS
jgi:catechol 2,3-dioxygenase-like lactoylglutathione lyase family enzyme